MMRRFLIAFSLVFATQFIARIFDNAIFEGCCLDFLYKPFVRPVLWWKLDVLHGTTGQCDIRTPFEILMFGMFVYSLLAGGAAMMKMWKTR
jgi:hypothetical protein